MNTHPPPPHPDGCVVQVAQVSCTRWWSWRGKQDLDGKPFTRCGEPLNPSRPCPPAASQLISCCAGHHRARHGRHLGAASWRSRWIRCWRTCLSRCSFSTGIFCSCSMHTSISVLECSSVCLVYVVYHRCLLSVSLCSVGPCGFAYEKRVCSDLP